MAGLLSDVLPYLYSQGDRLKRHAKGLLSDPAGTMAQTAGLLGDKHREQQGLMAQAFADPKAPFRVTDEGAMMQAAQAMLNGPLGMAPAGITAWHGSPHIFDKFDSSKIGTGEGAQAYGHGLYLAEAPDVAKQYAGALSAARATKPVGNVDLTQAYQNMPTDVPDTLLAARRDFRTLKELGELSPADRRDFLEAVKGNITAAQGGALYKVDLPDDAIAKMLDFDGAVPEPIRQRVSQAAMQRFGSGSTGTSGEHLYNEVVSEFRRSGSKNPAADATEFLRQQGIPGMKYLDGGSRGAGDGTRNFVVFPGEENILKILERNGQPLR